LAKIFHDTATQIPLYKLQKVLKVLKIMLEITGVQMKFIFLAALIWLASCGSSQVVNENKINPSAVSGTEFISFARQVTFEGKRSGEAYYNRQGDEIVFQSERTNSKNPFYQIFMKDLMSGKTWQVSPGAGKTTCAWIHPFEDKVMFSSTHHDPKSISKQNAEIKIRNSGQKRRYSWDYDKEYEIYSSTKKGKKLKRLTNTIGYDAEGSYSPDGKYIAFASNRAAYTSEMSDLDAINFKKNPSYMMDIYIMNSDGSNVKRLTTHKGYDGGPFFSPDGKRIVWRRFASDGRTAEIFTMNIDGSDKKQLTNSNSMSWAPFYHPSGDYIIYTTSIHGHHNFELYIVDVNGEKEPVRVTVSDGFDGLPVFSPDGDSLVWSKKLTNNESQVMMASWNDAKAREALGLSPRKVEFAYHSLRPEIQKRDIKKIINYLASDEMKGRLTGSEEEKVYTEKLAEVFSDMGLKGAGTKGTYFQNFDFVSKVVLGKSNVLMANGQKPVLNKDWVPLAFSKTGSQKSMPIVFGGYGIVAPADSEFKEYNSYKYLDIKDKWVMVFRYLPENIEAKQKQHLRPYARMYSKLVAAQVRGAKGIIFVSGPNSGVKSQLIKFGADDLKTTASLPAISITDELAQQWLGNNNLGKLQTDLDNGGKTPELQTRLVKLGAHITVEKKSAVGRNVLALLKVPGAKKTLIIGAHGDHLGVGKSSSSLMNSSDESDIHYGADDNASGVAGVLELAHHYMKRLKTDPKSLKQNILFAVWSGEEIGILGSNAFKNVDPKTNKKRKIPLSKNYTAYLNMDMIGRLTQNVSVQGVGSSDDWNPLIESLSLGSNLSMITAIDPYLPTDAMALYNGKLPVLSFFTGVHTDYHTPRDTPEKINYEGTEAIINLVSRFTDHLVSVPYGPRFKEADQKHNKGSRRGGFRVALGTIPDYSQGKVKGVLLSGVVKGGAAFKAGLKGGDIIVNISEFKINNIYDYVAALQSLKPNKKTTIVVMRSGKVVTLPIVPESKE
jgi:Tol biopolymer transport system component